MEPADRLRPGPRATPTGRVGSERRARVSPAAGDGRQPGARPVAVRGTTHGPARSRRHDPGNGSRARGPHDLAGRALARHPPRDPGARRHAGVYHRRARGADAEHRRHDGDLLCCRRRHAAWPAISRQRPARNGRRTEPARRSRAGTESRRAAELSRLARAADGVHRARGDRLRRYQPEGRRWPGTGDVGGAGRHRRLLPRARHRTAHGPDVHRRQRSESRSLRRRHQLRPVAAAVRRRT